jgi:hypothetical protein
MLALTSSTNGCRSIGIVRSRTQATGFVSTVNVLSVRCLQVVETLYSYRELVDMHFMYGLAGGKPVVARHLYEERYPGRRYPRWEVDRIGFLLVGLFKNVGVFVSSGWCGNSPKSNCGIFSVPGIWDRLLMAVRHRAKACIRAGGGHMEHLL